MTDPGSSPPPPPLQGPAPPPSPDPEGEGRGRSGASFARVARVLVLWTLVWWAVLGLVIAPWVPGGWFALAAMAAASLAGPLIVFSRAMTGRLYPGAVIRLLVFRPFWYLQLMIPLLGIAGVLGALVGLPFGAGRLAGLWAVAGAAVALWVAGLAGWVGSRLLVTRRLEAAFPDLPAGVDGLRIVQVSDLHVGPHTSRRHLAKVARAIREAAPDLVVFTGDQVDDYPGDTGPFQRAFGAIAAPLGVFSIPGNHDVYAGWAAVRRGLEAAGQRVLVNEGVELRRGGASVWLVGTGDPAGLGFTRGGGRAAAPDIPRALAQVPPGAFVVALAHNPVLWPALAGHGVPLTLSGHTHHGQLSVPRLDWSLASVFLEHAMGSHRTSDSLLYINPGTNYWGLPFRLGALPEVTVLTLRRGEGPVFRRAGEPRKGDAAPAQSADAAPFPRSPCQEGTRPKDSTGTPEPRDDGDERAGAAVEPAAAGVGPSRSPGARARPLRVAAVDIGSNAIRFSAAEFHDGNRRVELEYRRVAVRLGHSAFRTGRLTPENIQVAVEALTSFRRRLDTLGIRHVRVVATSAVRESRNGAELADRVWREAGLRVETIGGSEEARLVWLAVRDRFPLEGRWMLMDLGGGSLEVSVVCQGGIEWSESHAIGTVRLLEEAGSGPGSEPRTGRPLAEWTRDMRLPVLADEGLAGLIATGGNMEALAKLAGAAQDATGVSRLPVPELKALNRRLAAMTYRRRVDELGLREDRADVIVPAGRIYEGVAERTGAEAIVVPFAGVVDGVLLDLVDEPPLPSRVRRRAPE